MINRKGEVILKGDAGDVFEIIQNMPFAIRLTKHEGGGCEGEIYNLLTKQRIQSLPANYEYTYTSYKLTVNVSGPLYTYYFESNQDKFLNDKNKEISKELSSKLRKEFDYGKYESVMFILNSVDIYGSFSGFMFS